MGSEKATCLFCRLPKADLECEVCLEPVCRSCVVRLPEETFALMQKKPEVLTHSDYCPRCHDEHVAPELERYTETLERAKQVNYWPKSYRGNIPILKKARYEISVENGTDRDQVLLQLGFLAAEQGFNGLIQGELVGRKWRDHGYQKTEWSGRAWPANVDEGKLEREEFREAHWRVLHHR